MDVEIDEYAISILLRNLRGIATIEIDAPRVVVGRDLDYLHCHWAMSDQVANLARHVLENRHETQSLLTFKNRIDDVMARGRVDARATAIHRLLSGHPTAIVAAEPMRSYGTGPNHVLAWVLTQAWQHASRFSSWQVPGSGYEIKARETVRLLDQVRRIDAIKAAVSESPLRARPLSGSQVQAERSRRPIYRLAQAAYRLFVDVERGDSTAIASILRSTLLAPLENWRRFELAVALAVGETLSAITSERLHLEVLGRQAGTRVLRCGRFGVYWQTVTKLYASPPLEPSESLVQAILSAYDLGLASDRPDLVVIDEGQQKVLSIGEVKFHGGNDPVPLFREAVYQLVRYARGYDSEINNLLSHSFVAMNVEVPILQEAKEVPGAFSFCDLQQKPFESWVRSRWIQ